MVGRNSRKWLQQCEFSFQIMQFRKFWKSGFQAFVFLKLDSYKIFFKVPCVLVGNKIDCDRRQVSLEDAEKFAKSKKLVHFETSAKQNLNIADVFLHLTRLGLSEKHDTQRPKNDSVNLKSSKKKSKKGCC